MARSAQSDRRRARWVRSVEGCVVGRIAIKHFQNHGAVTFPVLARRSSMGAITTMWLQIFLSGCNVLSLDHSFKHFQCSQGLVERYFVARLVNSHKAEQVTLTNLSMNNTIRSGDVNEARVFVALGIDLFGNNLSTKPIAVEIARIRISTVYQSSQKIEGLTHLRNTAKPVLLHPATSSHSRSSQTRGHHHPCFQRHCPQSQRTLRSSGMRQ